jgi:enoyl-CoA hydratase/carnithine racemase
MSDRVSVTFDAGVADVRMNRPDKLNGLDLAMFEALVAVGAELTSRPGLRAAVLSGAGRAFCAGLDFASFLGGDGSGGPGGRLLARHPESPVTLAQRVAHVWTELPVPVIAAVHGVAYGGGCQIALAADIRLVAPDARLSVMEITWGLVPDMTGTQTLRHLVRQDVAKELTFTGRIVTGSEAVALGLATRVEDDPRAAALALAREIAGKSPDAIRAAKRLLNRAYEGDREEGLRREVEEQLRLLGSPNQLEAVQAKLEKRAPTFVDPA